MKSKSLRWVAAVAVLLATLAPSADAGDPVGTAFTFQGQLRQAGSGVSELCDFEFRLFDALTGGTQLGPTLMFDGVGGGSAVNVVSGLLTVRLDFGVGIFDGGARYLDVSVRCPSGIGGYTVLEPRQPICPAPYALYALDSPPDFNLPLAVTIASDQDLLALTNSMGGGSGGSALVGRASSSANPAILGEALGDGKAGVFRSFVAGSTAEVLEVFTTSDGTALQSETQGGGVAGDFLIGSSSNGSTTLRAKTVGTGRAGHFEVANANSTAVGLEITSDSSGDAVKSVTSGSGRAGSFEINVPMSADSASAALLATTNGSGSAGRFRINVPAPADNTAPAVEARTNGNGPGVVGFAPFEDGVHGETGLSGTFNLGPTSIRGGVHGTAATAVNAVDNFGVAGTQRVASQDFTGVLGVGENRGYGVVGVCGAIDAGRSVPGVWGMTREGMNGAGTWPPHFSIFGNTGPKGMVGVLGQAFAKVGVWGESIQRIGVIGSTGPASGATLNIPVGVYGRTAFGSPDNAAAGYFERVGSASAVQNTNPSAALVATTSAGGPAGLFVKTAAGTDLYPAVYGQGLGSRPAAVFRQAELFNAGAASGAAVHVINDRTAGMGLSVQMSNSANPAPALSVNSAGGWIAQFLTTMTSSSFNVGIIGRSSFATLVVENDNLGGYSARFEKNVPGATGGGVQIETETTGIALNVVQHGAGPVAVLEMNPPSSGNAVTIRNNHASGQALRVENASGGNALDVLGSMTVSGSKNFRIDHPLDPENRYLVHACIESDERRNLYDGVVATDARGYATVELPDWFEALNTDFRYQLTVIDETDGDGFALARIVRPIEGNCFTIRTSAPRVIVSWQVTGVRHDAYARAHPLQVEVAKPAAGLSGTAVGPE